MSERILTCAVCGVTSESKHIKYTSKTNCYLCAKHYAQIYKHNKITDPTPRTTADKNEYIEKEDYVEMILRDSKQQVNGICLIDKEEADRCKQHKWSLTREGENKFYVKARINGKNIRLHRFIMNYYEHDKEIDHKNRNTLDNRKSNLRIVYNCENASNNVAKGVTKTSNGRYRATFQRYGKYFEVGTFKTEKEAIAARKIMIEEVDKNKESLLEEFAERKKNNYPGVVIRPSGRWRAYIFQNNKKYGIGTFDTKEEAIQAREAKLKEMNIFNETA